MSKEIAQYFSNSDINTEHIEDIVDENGSDEYGLVIDASLTQEMREQIEEMDSVYVQQVFHKKPQFSKTTINITTEDD